MNESILETIKKLIGIDKSINSFDEDLIININSAISELRQMGIRPDGYRISSKYDNWSSYLTETPELFESVKVYIYIKTKLIFDPPTNSSTLNMYQQYLNELAWRLNVTSETKL